MSWHNIKLKRVIKKSLLYPPGENPELRRYEDSPRGEKSAFPNTVGALMSSGKDRSNKST